MRSSKLKKCIIICNGKIYKKDLKKLIEINEPRKAIKIIACDGASDFLRTVNISPDVIIGDLDSVSPQTLKFFSRKGTVIKKVYDQDKNDLEKAIIYALSKKYKAINIIGFGGKRLDHTLNNLSILKKFHRKAKIRIYENGFTGEIISKSAEFDCKAGDTVSLIPLPKATGVTTTGLKYPLKNGTLELGVREGALNEANGNKVTVKIKQGEFLLLTRSN